VTRELIVKPRASPDHFCDALSPRYQVAFKLLARRKEQNHLERLITANFQVSTALINEERIA
jgi:hypothetical protein